MNTIDNERRFSIGADTSYARLHNELSGIAPEEGIAIIKNFINNCDKIPDIAEAHNDLGVLYYRTGNKLLTLGHYEKAVRLSPQNITFRKNLASFYFAEMGWVDEAIEIYVEIMKSFPTDTEVLVALAIISEAVGRPDEARIFLQRVISLEPWNSEAQQALNDLNKPAEATLEELNNLQQDINVPATVSEIDEILAGLRNPSTPVEEHTESIYRKALKLAEDGMIEHAISDLNHILQKGWNAPLIHNDLGVLYSRLGNNQKALQHNENAVAMDPGNVSFAINLANLYYSSLGRPDDAIDIYTGIVRNHPENLDALSAMAIICIDNNRPDEAMVFLNKVIELDPANSDARNLADRLRNGGNGNFFLAAG